MRKRTSGIKTAVIILLLAIGLVYGIYRLTDTHIFEISREDIIQLAGKASITDFKKSCKIYDSTYLTEHEDDVKGKPIYYRGKILDIKTSAFGDSQVMLYVVEDSYKIDKDTNVIIKMADDKYLRANKGDYVQVYGRFNSVKNNDTKKTIYIDGVRIDAD